MVGLHLEFPNDCVLTERGSCVFFLVDCGLDFCVLIAIDFCFCFFSMNWMNLSAFCLKKNAAFLILSAIVSVRLTEIR